MGYFKDIICTGVIRCLSKIYSPEFVGKLTGNADSASKLATARNIALTGSVTGNANFDGSGNISIFTSTNHTHNYASSGSAGGSANSAVKLDTATAGSATQPVYFTGGKPTACTYTLGKSVPSNAVFTDTDVRNTAGATNTSSKIFLVGATSQAANPQTYSHDTAYVGTDGCLYSNSKKVSVEGHTHEAISEDFIRGLFT